MGRSDGKALKRHVCTRKGGLKLAWHSRFPCPAVMTQLIWLVKWVGPLSLPPRLPSLTQPSLCVLSEFAGSVEWDKLCDLTMTPNCLFWSTCQNQQGCWAGQWWGTMGLSASLYRDLRASRPLAGTPQPEGCQEKMIELSSLGLCYLPDKCILWGPSLILADPLPCIRPGDFLWRFPTPALTTFLLLSGLILTERGHYGVGRVFHLLLGQSHNVLRQLLDIQALWLLFLCCFVRAITFCSLSTLSAFAFWMHFWIYICQNNFHNEKAIKTYKSTRGAQPKVLRLVSVLWFGEYSFILLQSQKSNFTRGVAREMMGFWEIIQLGFMSLF